MPHVNARNRFTPFVFVAVLALFVGFCLAAAQPQEAYAADTGDSIFNVVGSGKASDGTYDHCIVSNGGAKITLTTDVVLSDYWYITTTTKDITIDLNGHALSARSTRNGRGGAASSTWGRRRILPWRTAKAAAS